MESLRFAGVSDYRQVKVNVMTNVPFIYYADLHYRVACSGVTLMSDFCDITTYYGK